MLALVVAACGSNAPVARIGEPAPPIMGATLDGKAFDLAAYRGKPLVVNFWASWCTPCREEFPMFKEKLEALGADGRAPDGGRPVRRTSLTSPGRSSTTSAPRGRPSTDPDGAIAKAYRVVAPPQTYFIDKDGILRGIQIGEVRPEDFDTQYAKIAP